MYFISLFQLRFKVKDWKTATVVLNVTYVQEKQKRSIDYYGQEQYEFLREDFKQCLDMFAEDLSKSLPSDTVSRLISLHGIVHGNRTEIETALVSQLIEQKLLRELPYKNPIK